MAVYVDNLMDWGGEGWLAGKWCHLWADTPEELHAMAEQIGLRRAWFQDRGGFPHYDLRRSKREAALQHGAQDMPLKEWINKRKSET